MAKLSGIAITGIVIGSLAVIFVVGKYVITPMIYSNKAEASHIDMQEQLAKQGDAQGIAYMKNLAAQGNKEAIAFVATLK